MAHRARGAVVALSAMVGAIALLFGLAAARAQQAICAEVKIEIRQRVTLERQAFDAALRITNGLSTAVENLSVAIKIEREDGLPMDPSAFARRFDRTDGAITGGSDGPWQIPGTTAGGPQSVGSLHWLLIPAAATGGVFPEGQRYKVAATINYSIAGEDKEVEVTPEVITVLPQPLLEIDYFLPTEVYGDDPFTEEVEPSVPFTLGVRVKNVGHGDARALAIDTAQPVIRDNPQGLLVGFEIVSAAVDDEEADSSLLMRFGDLPAQENRVGRWSMLTTLSGQFFDFEAEYVHADSLGGPLTSLIASNPIPTHMLVKDVLVTGRSDTVLDFLAYDADILRVYESSGVDTVVEDVSASAAISGGSGGQYTLTVPPQAAGTFVYLKIPNTFPSNETDFSIVRGGLPLPAINAWISKTRQSNGVGWDYYFNLFDASPAESYSVQLTDAPVTAELRGLVYIDANDNGIFDGGEASVPDAAIRLTGISVANVPVEREFHTNNAGRYAFTDLPAGTYGLEVAAVADHVNGQHGVGTAGGVASEATIAGIVLEDGETASDYLFAKRFDPQSTLLQANLGIEFVNAPSASVEVGELFQVELRLMNSGPDDAEAVRVNLSIPPSLQIVGATPTAGTFNTHQRFWIVEGLANNAHQSLIVQLKGTEADEFMLGALVAHASGGIVDSVTINNQAMVPVTVEQLDEIELNAEAVELPRVLAFVGCSFVTGTGECANPPDLNLWQQMFNALGPSESLVTVNHEEFLLELREGWANVIWLTDYSPALYPDELTAEIVMSVFQGDGLIVDAIIGSIHPLQAISSTNPLSNTNPVSIVMQPPLQSLPLSTAVSAWCINTLDAAVLAIYDLQPCPAIIQSGYGGGKAVSAGFSLSGVNSPSARDELFRTLIERVIRQPRLIHGPGERVDISITTSNGDEADQFVLSAESDADTTIRNGFPTPTEVLPSRITWQGTFVPDVDLLFHAGLSLGSGEPGGNEQIVVKLELSGGEIRLTQVDFSTITVEELIEEASTRLSALALSSPADEAVRDAIQADLDITLAHYAEEEYEEAIGLLVANFAFQLSYPEDEHVLFIRTTIAQAYKAMARIQAPLLPVCDASGGTPLVVNSAGFRPIPFYDSGVHIRPRDSQSWLAVLGTDAIQNLQKSFQWSDDEGLGWLFQIRSSALYFIVNRACPTCPVGTLEPPIVDLEYPDGRWEMADAMLFEVASTEEALDQTIEMIISEIDGNVMSITPLTAGGGQEQRNRAAISLRQHGGVDTSVISGTMEIDFPGQLPSTDALRVRIVPGILRCREP